MKNTTKTGRIAANIVEVFHWVAAVLMLCATVCSLFKPEWVGFFVDAGPMDARCGAQLNVYGFEVTAKVENGMMDMTAFFLFGIGATLILVFMAMIFRNLHLIFKLSENGSPFQKDNIRMMKEIGIFSIFIPAAGFVMSVICRLVLGANGAETSVSMFGVVMGILVLCLTQFFIHGAKLEEDVDGLL